MRCRFSLILRCIPYLPPWSSQGRIRKRRLPVPQRFLAVLQQFFHSLFLLFHFNVPQLTLHNDGQRADFLILSFSRIAVVINEQVRQQGIPVMLDQRCEIQGTSVRSQESANGQLQRFNKGYEHYTQETSRIEKIRIT